MDEVHEAIASFFAQAFRVRSDVSDDSHDGFIDGFQQPRSVVDELVNSEEYQVAVGAFELRDVHRNSHGVRLVHVERKFSTAAHCQQHKNAHVH